LVINSLPRFILEILFNHPVELVLVELEVMDILLLRGLHQKDKCVEHHHLGVLEKFKDVIATEAIVELLLHSFLLEVSAARISYQGVRGHLGMWLLQIQIPLL
jgi:hypothetical protein